MTVYVGTSGFSFPEWRGSFYPDKFPTAKMLAYYAERFNTVEINYTFYRVPTEKLLQGWAQGTPGQFAFTLKAPRRITHDSKLQNVADLTQTFCRTAATLGTKLGVLLFQLPPTLKRNDAVFASFLDTLPEGTRAAFEFRHESWHDNVILETLRRRNLSLCIAESEKTSTPIVQTADYTYSRLRDEGYQSGDIERWASVVRSHDALQGAYVYFTHEEQGKGPEFAQALMTTLGTGP